MASEKNKIQCEILLESGKTIQYTDGVQYLHYPGQSVFGKVVLTVYFPTYFQALDVGISGEANTEFDKYFGIEEYFMDLLNLDYNIKLQPGEYSYPFSFKLPMKLPFSFESKYGSVTFEIAVVTDLETTNPDVIGELLLRIASNINLNSFPKLKKPVTNEVYKDAKIFRFCCCFKFGEFSLTTSIPCSGYCPTQKIPITFDCNNKSNVKITSLSVILEKIVTYKKSRLSTIMKIDKEEIATFKTRGISERERVKFEDQIIIPPKTLPTELACGIIDITYWLKVKVNVKGCYNTPSPKYLTKIVIGDTSINDMDGKLGAGKSYWEPQENEMLSSKPSIISKHSIRKSLALIKQSSFKESLLNQKNLLSKEPSTKKSQNRKREDSPLVRPQLNQYTQTLTEAFPNPPVRSFSQQKLGPTQGPSSQQNQLTSQSSNQRNEASILPLSTKIIRSLSPLLAPGQPNLQYTKQTPYKKSALSPPPISLSTPPLPLPAPPLPLPAPPLPFTSPKNEPNRQASQ